MHCLNSGVRQLVLRSLHFLAFLIFRKAHPLDTLPGLIRNAPVTLTVSVFPLDFGNLALVLSSQSFQTALFHQVGKIMQCIEIARHAIVIADTAKFCVIDR